MGELFQHDVDDEYDFDLAVIHINSQEYICQRPELQVGASGMKGRRPEMEDEHLICPLSGQN